MVLVIQAATILRAITCKRAIRLKPSCVDLTEVIHDHRFEIWDAGGIGVLLLIDRSSYILWSGSTTLDIVISVCDQQSGKPIPGTIIEIVADGNVNFATANSWRGKIIFITVHSQPMIPELADFIARITLVVEHRAILS